MGKKKCLSQEERRLISRLHKDGMSCREIARHIKRSFSSVAKFIRSGETYGTHRSTGRPPALSMREKRLVLRIASNSCKTANAIAKEAGIHTKIRNVQRLLQRSKNIVRKKIKRKPVLNSRHKMARLAFAEKVMSWTEQWKKVIFSDEKKFNLDGPDGYSYYFHDLRKEEVILSRRQMGGGSVMVWASIGYKKRGNLVFLSKRVNSEEYRNLLEEQKNTFNDMAEGSPVFQQDNAPIHSARIIKEWFTQNNVDKLDWPAVSPDLNIIENVWGILSRSVYSESRQYSTIEELKSAILASWEEIPQETLKKLYDSMSKRIFEVIKGGGKATKF